MYIMFCRLKIFITHNWIRVPTTRYKNANASSWIEHWYLCAHFYLIWNNIYKVWKIVRSGVGEISSTWPIAGRDVKFNGYLTFILLVFFLIFFIRCRFWRRHNDNVTAILDYIYYMFTRPSSWPCTASTIPHIVTVSRARELGPKWISSVIVLARARHRTVINM